MEGSDCLTVGDVQNMMVKLTARVNQLKITAYDLEHLPDMPADQVKQMIHSEVEVVIHDMNKIISDICPFAYNAP